MATITITRTDAWALFAFVAAIICAIAFGQAIGKSIGLAAAVLFLDWAFAVVALAYLRRFALQEADEVHP